MRLNLGVWRHWGPRAVGMVLAIQEAGDNDAITAHETFVATVASTEAGDTCAATAVANWTPAKLSAITKFWIQPDQTASVTLTSGKVSSIADVNAAGATFSQATAGNRPVITSANASFNSKDTMTIAGGLGANTWLLNGPDMSAMTSGEGWFVGKATADPPANSFNSGWWGFGNVNNTAGGIPLTSTGKVQDNFGTGVLKTTGIDPGNFAAVFAYGVVSNANDWRAYFNSLTPFFSTATNTVSFPASGVTLGRTQGSWGTDGDLAMCIVFTQELTSQQRSDLRRYMQIHFGAP